MTVKNAAANALPRYVELVRVSSTGQAERDTPEDQRRALARLAAARPGQLVERIEHGAAGLSGAAALNDRPDLLRLAELSRDRAYDELRVRHLDRLTRHADPRERFAIFGMVQEAGAVIVDASGGVIDPADPSGGGEVSYFLQTWMSAQEKRRILERTKEGRRRKLACGEIIACAPWGRRLNKATRSWTTDEKVIGLYRRLFDEILAGTTAGRLAEKLNYEGQVTPRGGRWSARAICDLIHATHAVGRIEQADAIIDCPPVVDEATWEAARAQLAANASTRKGPRGSIPALLRGVATCANCGSTMHVDRAGRKGRKVTYYVCGNVRTNGASADDACRGFHRVEDVDAKVRDELRNLLDHPNRLLAGVTAGRRNDVPVADAGEAERELAGLDVREQKLLRLASKGLASEEGLEKQLAEVQRLRVIAQKRLAAARCAEDVAARDASARQSVEAAVEALRARARSAGDEDYHRLIVALFPRSEDTWLRICQDGTIDARGLLDVSAAPADQRRISRATIIRCTSLVPSPISHSFASR
jgi:DNA invertase Pin-like site-specific DNA recombinase